MRALKSHLAQAGKMAKLPVGPVLPKPSPMLPRQSRVEEKQVSMSVPQRATRTEEIIQVAR